MTASTLPVLLLIAFLWWRTKGELLPIILFTSIFDAASAINLGSSPISPWLLALLICLPIKLLLGKFQWRTIEGTNRTAFRALVIFVAYAGLSSVLYPILFHGIPVSNSRNGLNQPLMWTMSNFSQLGYLLAAFTVFLIAIHSSREQLRSAVNWYIRASVCVALFSMYQLANAVLHVPYPSAILYTNTTHVIYDAYKISGVWRLNSTLPEASEAAFYLGTGLALLGWQIALQRLRWRTALQFLLILAALIMTVSTVGYACMAAMAIGGIALYVRHTFRRGSISPPKLVAMLVLVGVFIPLLVLTNTGTVIMHVLQGVFVDKVNSDSYKERSLWNELALQTAVDSYYFGAGWGSVRASSFTCSLMGNVGVPGVLLFLNFILQLLRPLMLSRFRARFELYERSLFGILVVLAALVTATPDPIMPIIWVLFAVAVAGKPRLLYQERFQRMRRYRTQRMVADQSTLPLTLETQVADS